MKTGNIYLIGFMGAGKSAVSRQLSDITGIPCLEMDQEIEKTAGCRITDIFTAEGEEGFRLRETAQLKKTGAGSPRIVSCGGGVVLREENVRIMKDTGVVILLTAAPETIFKRVRHSTRRPVLNGHMDPAYIRDLMEKRRPFYESAADCSVPTDGMTPREIALEILSRFTGNVQ